MKQNIDNKEKEYTVTFIGKRICLHCDIDIEYQPAREAGCSHVHYPEACDVCSEKAKSWKDHRKDLLDVFDSGGTVEKV